MHQSLPVQVGERAGQRQAELDAFVEWQASPALQIEFKGVGRVRLRIALTPSLSHPMGEGVRSAVEG